LDVRVLAIECENPEGSVPITVSQIQTDGSSVPADPLELKDNGELPDECPGDGEYAGSFNAPTLRRPPGEYRVTFWNPAIACETLTIKVQGP
jgi:hypothetical protein